MVNKRALGSEKELLAANYLKNLGLNVINMNFRCKTGEIDIVAEDGDYLVFCEVKYRKSTGYGSPIEAVNTSKQNKIRQVARFYLIKNQIPQNKPIRFDVIGILGDHITYIKDAF